MQIIPRNRIMDMSLSMATKKYILMQILFLVNMSIIYIHIQSLEKHGNLNIDNLPYSFLSELIKTGQGIRALQSYRALLI